MDIVVNVNIDAGKQVPKVEVKQKPIVKKPVKKTGGVLQFPAPQAPQGSGVLDFLGIKET